MCRHVHPEPYSLPPQQTHHFAVRPHYGMYFLLSVGDTVWLDVSVCFRGPGGGSRRGLWDSLAGITGWLMAVCLTSRVFVFLGFILCASLFCVLLEALRVGRSLNRPAAALNRWSPASVWCHRRPRFTSRRTNEPCADVHNIWEPIVKSDIDWCVCVCVCRSIDQCVYRKIKPPGISGHVLIWLKII